MKQIQQLEQKVNELIYLNQELRKDKQVYFSQINLLNQITNNQEKQILDLKNKVKTVETNLLLDIDVLTKTIESKEDIIKVWESKYPNLQKQEVILVETELEPELKSE